MNYADAVGDAIKGALCEYAKLDEAANSFFNELSPIDIPSAGKFWRPRLCDEDPSDVIPPPPPFEGGQCPGVGYNGLIRADFGPPTGVITLASFTNAIGPLSRVLEDFNGRTILRVIQGNGQQAAAGDPSTPDITPFVVITGRVDGQPDDCGNPPVEIPPFVPTTLPISPTYITNEGDEITVNGDFTLFAPVGIFAPVTTVIAPVRVNLGGVTFDGTLELAPDFNFNFGTPPGDSSPGDSDDFNEPEDPGSSPDTPDDESDERLIGVYVRSRKIGRTQQTEIDMNNAPDLFVPRLANVFFRVRNRGTLGWFGPIDVKTTSAFIPVPANTFAVASRVDFEPGWTGEKADVRRVADFGA